jgi:HMG-box domain
MAGEQAFSVAQFVAQETALFYEHIKTSTAKFEEDGTVPKSLFGQKVIRALQKAGGKRGGGANGQKRKPTAFNLFIKEKLAEMNAKDSHKDVPYKEKFSMVVAKWGALSDDKKQQYATKYAAQLAAPVAEAEKRDAPSSSEDDESTDEEEEHKKKKKKEKVRLNVVWLRRLA